MPLWLFTKGDLLPAVVKKDALALVELKREFYKVKKQRSLYGIVWFLKEVLVLFAKLVRYIVLASTRLVSFVLFSVIVILSTTIITQNIVNSIYGVKEPSEQDSNYSIYYVKDDDEAKINAKMMEQNSKKVSAERWTSARPATKCWIKSIKKSDVLSSDFFLS